MLKKMETVCEQGITASKACKLFITSAFHQHGSNLYNVHATL